MRRPFSKIEDSLEFMIERPFAKVFRRSVQPAEVGKRLKKELTTSGVVSVRGRVAPNDFIVLLAPDDITPYLEHGRLLADDLAEWLEDLALAENIITLDAIHIRFETESSLRPGTFEVKSSIRESDATPAQYQDPGLTLPFEISQQQTDGIRGYIEICSGPNTGAIFPVRKQNLTIGRDLGNDLVIDSPEVSRFHAEMQATLQGQVLNDQNSLNGTFVNGVQITYPRLVENGDQIIFGTTICRFWTGLL